MSRAALAALALSVMLVAACSPPGVDEGGTCLFNGDCRDPLVCAGRRCRLPCRDARDCAGGYECRRANVEAVMVCLPPETPSPCLYSRDCDAAQVCRFGECVVPCDAAGRCPGGQRCDALGRCLPLARDAGLDASTDAAAPDAAPDAGGADVLPDAGLDAAPDAPVADGGADGGGSGALFTSVCAASFQTCALARDGAVWCWGGDFNGVLGRGTVPGSPTAEPSPARVIGLSDVVALACARFGFLDSTSPHVCALTRDGAVWCWGGNASGQLGTAPGTGVGVPARVPGFPPMVAIAVGGAFTCGLDPTAQVHCAGRTITGSTMTTATQLPLPEPLGEIAAGADFACGRALTGGALYCWGATAASFGGLPGGYPTPGFVEYPTVPTADFAALAMGSRTSCAIMTTGEARCWGSSVFGSAGVAPYDTATIAEPTAVTGLGPVRALAQAATFGCALLADRTVRCWGLNAVGVHGDGTVGGAPGLGGVVPLRDVIALSTSENHPTTSAAPDPNFAAHACAVTADGAVWCWGSNDWGEVGNGVPVGMNAPSPVRVAF